MIKDDTDDKRILQFDWTRDYIGLSIEITSAKSRKKTFCFARY